MFKSAKRVWLKGLSDEMNLQARFVASVKMTGCEVLYVTGASLYKVYLDGELITHGPSPTATGYARVDVLELPRKRGEVSLVIEVAGYRAHSYATVNQPSYIIAEVRRGDEAVAFTGRDFKGYKVASREQKTLRYSFQRYFSEVWNLDRADVPHDVEILPDDIKYLERKAPLPTLDKEAPSNDFCKGKFTIPGEIDVKADYVIEHLDQIVPGKEKFELDEIGTYPIAEINAADYFIKEEPCEIPSVLSSGEFCVFECERNSSGIIHIDYIAPQGARIALVFDEMIADGRFANRIRCSNVIEINGEGAISFDNFEIYGFKYYAVFVLSGEIELQGIHKIKIRHCPKNIPTLNTDDEELLAIYEASLESYRSNSLGIFMDCPTRERAGWLCDSLFISRGSYEITGNTFVEDDFLENFLKHGCKTIPEGMLPMCYPSEHPNGRFIPQWALWFIMQIPEYKARNPKVDLSSFRDTVYGILGFFSKYENEYTLLEDLPSWNFVEWSAANKWCDGVNYPTNMLYAAALSAVCDMYGDEPLKAKAEKIRETVREMSFDGKFFHDQAERDENGKLVFNKNISETCQYYAFYFGTADEEKYADLKNTLLTEFGPDSENYPEIEKSNAFMGALLRMDLLVKWKKEEMLINQIKGYYLHMARLTGTLWEHKTTGASLNHGFPSYIAGLLLRILGRK